jgi:prevent-host-death family protein
MPQRAHILTRDGRLLVSHECYSQRMARHVTQRELRNDSGEIMRALDRGESFIVTRNGVPVGELVPARRRRFVNVDGAVAAFTGAAPMSYERFRAEVDAVLDQDPSPRG